MSRILAPAGGWLSSRAWTRWSCASMLGDGVGGTWYWNRYPGAIEYSAASPRRSVRQPELERDPQRRRRSFCDVRRSARDDVRCAAGIEGLDTFEGVTLLGVDTVVVMQHTKCGLVGVTDAELRNFTGADLGFFPIDDHASAESLTPHYPIGCKRPILDTGYFGHRTSTWPFRRPSNAEALSPDAQHHRRLRHQHGHGDRASHRVDRRLPHVHARARSPLCRAHARERSRVRRCNSWYLGSNVSRQSGSSHSAFSTNTLRMTSGPSRSSLPLMSPIGFLPPSGCG